MRRKSTKGTRMAIGIAVGAGIGAAIGSVAVGIAVGVAIGAALTANLGRKDIPPSDADPMDPNHPPGKK